MTMTNRMLRIPLVNYARNPGTWLGILAILCLSIAACSQDEPEVGSQDEFQPGPLGAVEIAPGEAIQIRSMNVLTGLRNLGDPNMRGTELAVEDYGPIKEWEVSMGAAIDSRCTAEGGRAAAQTVTGDPRVLGAIGTYCSVAAAAAAPIISDAGLVMVAPSNTSPSLTSDLEGNPGSNHHDGYYRVANNDLHQAKFVAKYAYNELGIRSVAAIHDGDPYTTGLTGAFKTEFEKLGGSVELLAVARGDTQMTPVLTSAAAENPDALFFPIFPLEATHIVQQIGDVPGLEDVTLIAGAALLTPEFLALPETEGTYFPSNEFVFTDTTNQATGRRGDELDAVYHERYGVDLTSTYLSHAYDATTILLNAIERTAVEQNGKLYVDRAKLRENLTATSGFQGIVGSLTCDEFGDCGTARILILHHTDSNVTDVEMLPIVSRSAP